MKRTFLFLSILCLMAGAFQVEAAEDFNYISAAALKARMDAGSSVLIVDICPAEQFAAGHIQSALETNAYPVKTQADKDKLAKLLPAIQASGQDIVIVCPRGAGGAKRTFAYYLSQQVEKSRLLILEKGMNGWPYDAEGK